MEHAVRIERLPDGIEFPSELQQRISFDPVRKRLVFRGFMCKADYDRLALLHTNFEYQRAIQRLFQISTDADQPGRRWLFGLATALLLIAVVGFGSLPSDATHRAARHALLATEARESIHAGTGERVGTSLCDDADDEQLLAGLDAADIASEDPMLVPRRAGSLANPPAGVSDE